MTIPVGFIFWPFLRLRFAYATPKVQNRCFADSADLDFHILFLRLIQVDGLIIIDWFKLSVINGER